ncbi:MAG: Cof-type HAD-IIB family hydrolase [Erysipelotrichaceae bacterium]|nr:Cof-type HAD-IIB family hydrolase [Erysipelotrichaceae bacterium]
MKTKIKALFIDFDGTLFSHAQHAFPDSAITAIDAARANDILVFLCTGRAKPELTQFDMTPLNIDGMVLCNGQVVLASDGRIIFDNPIKGSLKKRMVDVFVNRKLPIYFANNEELILNFENEKIRKVQDAISSHIPPIKEYHGEDFYMASAFYENDEELALLNSFKDEAEVTSWHDGAVDIVPIGACKSYGISKTLEILNIPIEETIGFGDGDNDIDMLKACGIGVAMDNAPDFVKEAADHVTDHIDEDGLYKAFKHFELI